MLVTPDALLTFKDSKTDKGRTTDYKPPTSSRSSQIRNNVSPLGMNLSTYALFSLKKSVSGKGNPPSRTLWSTLLGPFWWDQHRNGTGQDRIMWDQHRNGTGQDFSESQRTGQDRISFVLVSPVSNERVTSGPVYIRDPIIKLVWNLEHYFALVTTGSCVDSMERNGTRWNPIYSRRERVVILPYPMRQDQSRLKSRLNKSLSRGINK